MVHNTEITGAHYLHLVMTIVIIQSERSIFMICRARVSLISPWRGTGCDTLVVGL